MSGKIKNKQKPVNQDRIFAIIIFLFVFAIYGNSIRNNYNLDDEFVTNGNPQVAKGLKGIPEIFTTLYSQRQNLSYGYRPVVKATYAIEYQFLGWDPHISHFLNVLLYALCCWLLFLVLRKIFQYYNPKLFFAIVLLFAAHPIHTEVVNSLKNRDEILSLLFALWSMLLIIKYYDSKKIISFVVAILLFALAVLSKLNAVTFIIIIPLAIYFRNNGIKGGIAGFSIEKQDLTLFKTKLLEYSSNGLLIFFIAMLYSVYCFTSNQKLPAFVFYILYIISLLIPTIRSFSKKKKLFHGIAYLFILSGIILLTDIIVDKDPIPIVILYSLYFIIYYLLILDRVSLKRRFEMILSFFLKYRVLIVVFTILTIIFIITFYLPKTYLPETKAKVEYWQNPQYFANESSYFSNGFYTLLVYFKLLIFPYQLSFYYGYNMIPAVGLFNINVILSFLISTILLFYALIKIKHRNILSFGLFLYFITISMFSNFYVPVAGIIGERLVFTSSIGFSIVLVVIILLLTKNSLSDNKLKGSALMILSIILLLYSIKTVSRNSDWKDRHTLFTADIGHLQNSVKANDLIAALLFGEAKKDIDVNRNLNQNIPKLNKVIEYYKQAIKVYPDHFNAYYNIGLVYLIYFQDYNNAIDNFENCLRINPDFDDAYPDLAYSYSKTGNMTKAIEKAKIMMSKDSTNITNIAFLADLQLKNKDFKACEELNQKILKFSPESDIGYINEGNLYAAMGDTIKALGFLEKAYEKNRNNRNTIIALYNFYSSTGNLEKTEYYKNLLRR